MSGTLNNNSVAIRSWWYVSSENSSVQSQQLYQTADNCTSSWIPSCLLVTFFLHLPGYHFLLWTPSPFSCCEWCLFFPIPCSGMTGCSTSHMHDFSILTEAIHTLASFKRSWMKVKTQAQRLKGRLPSIVITQVKWKLPSILSQEIFPPTACVEGSWWNSKVGEPGPLLQLYFFKLWGDVDQIIDDHLHDFSRRLTNSAITC